MMKMLVAAAAVTFATMNAPLAVAPAEAATVTKRVVMHHGPLGHGCRKVVTTVRSHGRMIRNVRRVCR